MIPFRHCIREPHGPAVKFEILVATPNEFRVRYPDYDYIKWESGRQCYITENNYCVSYWRMTKRSALNLWKNCIITWDGLLKSCMRIRRLPK